MIELGSKIATRWTVKNKLCLGGQATVYEAFDSVLNKNVVVKVNTDCKDLNILRKEKKMYERVSTTIHGGQLKVLPEVYHYDQDIDHEVLILEKLGETILDYHRRTESRLPNDKFVAVFKRLLSCLEVLHNAGIVHGDVKPPNICLGVGNNIDDIKLIDLGMSKTYIDPASGNHIAQVTSNNFTGTIPFSSLNMHNRGTMNRIDDLESLCYTMMGLYAGRLSWVTEAKNGNARPFLVAKKWKSKPVDELCAGFPKFFAGFLAHLRKIPYGHHPDYWNLHALLNDAAKNFQGQSKECPG